MWIRLARWLLLLAVAGASLAQVAILQIRVLEGEGLVHGPGTRSTRPVVVQVTDETGRPVANAAVTLHMPEEGPGGVLGNGLRTDMALTDANGHASFRNLQLNRTPGRFDIRILAVKEQARAGTVFAQYISEGNGRAAPEQAQARSSRKWLAVALLVAGAAAAGVGVSTRGGNAQASGGTVAPPAIPAIGTPTITLGKP